MTVFALSKESNNVSFIQYFGTWIWFPLFVFRKNVLVYLSLPPWAFVFKVSRNLKSKASNLVLDLYTWSVIFYDVGFLCCMFLMEEKIFLSINVTCHIFHVFPFECFDQDSHPLVNKMVSVVHFATLICLW